MPNDPRGSGSDYVYSERLRQFGLATKVSTSHSVAHNPHNVQQRLAAKNALKFPPVRLTGVQALAVSKGFRQVVTDTQLKIYACAIMPDHVHLVFAVHLRTAESLVNQLKSCATKQLTAEGLHPFNGEHSPWQRSFWNVFLDSDDDVHRAIRYVEQNPVRDGLKPQKWSFVVPFVI
ncbi:MAG: transposase [Planctomycetaceae bacterium]|nr:transposase [Planctomycetaceae bacterium]